MELAIALFVTVWVQKRAAYVMVMVFTTVTAAVIRVGCVTAWEESNVFFVMVTENATIAMALATKKIHRAVTMMMTGTMTTIVAMAHHKSYASIAREKKTAGTTSIFLPTNTIVTGVANVSGVEATDGQEALDSMFRVPIVTNLEKWVV